MSEKLDGIRAYWNGKILATKHGNEIMCPPWFIEGFQSGIKLDGELWMQRGMLERVISLVNGHSKGKYSDDPAWKQLKYFVFDMPGSVKSYESRIEDLISLQLPPHAIITNIHKCNGKEHLLQTLETVLNNGGEGLMLCKPNSAYVSHRTKTLLKVKVDHTVS